MTGQEQRCNSLVLEKILAICSAVLIPLGVSHSLTFFHVCDTVEHAYDPYILFFIAFGDVTKGN